MADFKIYSTNNQNAMTLTAESMAGPDYNDIPIDGTEAEAEEILNILTGESE